MTTKENNKLKVAIGINGLIIIFEMIGLIMSVNDWGWWMFEFYTQDSNYFALFASIFFEIFAVRKLISKKEMPPWVNTIRYMASCGLFLTFFIVLTVLTPLSGFSSIIMMFTYGTMLYHHFLCPVLSVVSFLIFEPQQKMKKKTILIALIPTVFYAIVIVILNVLKIVYGPYPFLHVYEQPVWVSVIWYAVIIGIAALISWVLWMMKNKIAKKTNRIS